MSIIEVHLYLLLLLLLICKWYLYNQYQIDTISIIISEYKKHDRKKSEK